MYVRMLKLIVLVSVIPCGNAQRGYSEYIDIRSYKKENIDTIEEMCTILDLLPYIDLYIYKILYNVSGMSLFLHKKSSRRRIEKVRNEACSYIWK